MFLDGTYSANYQATMSGKKRSYCTRFS